MMMKMKMQIVIGIVVQNQFEKNALKWFSRYKLAHKFILMMTLGRHNGNVISIFDLITISFTFTLKTKSWRKAILYDRF